MEIHVFLISNEEESPEHWLRTWPDRDPENDRCLWGTATS